LPKKHRYCYLIFFIILKIDRSKVVFRRVVTRFCQDIVSNLS